MVAGRETRNWPSKWLTIVEWITQFLAEHHDLFSWVWWTQDRGFKSPCWWGEPSLWGPGYASQTLVADAKASVTWIRLDTPRHIRLLTSFLLSQTAIANRSPVINSYHPLYLYRFLASLLPHWELLGFTVVSESEVGFRVAGGCANDIKASCCTDPLQEKN